MELWIRSQDKKHLMKCEAIMLEKLGSDKYGIRVFTKNYDFNIASYETKERALEIVDEIQRKILKSVYYRASEDYGKHSDCKDTLIENYGSTYVYEMPQE